MDNTLKGLVDKFYLVCFGDIVFSKWVEMYGLSTFGAIEVANYKIDLVCRNGVPEGLVSDQGRNLELNTFKQVLDLLDVHDQHETVHSQNVDATEEDAANDATHLTNTPQAALEPSEPVDTFVRHDADATAQVIELEQSGERPHEAEVLRARSTVRAKRGRPRKRRHQMLFYCQPQESTLKES
jgi:hypothetical protein